MERRPPAFSDHTSHCREIMGAALRAADAAKALDHHWVGVRGRVYMLAVGKASVPMGCAAAGRIGAALAEGVVTAPPESAGARDFAGLPVRIFACDHPLPTARNVEAARAAAGLAARVGAEDTLVALVSGGGSAHLTLPAAGLTLEDLAEVTRLLQLAGAPIGELNTVRKHCEDLKGGRLAAMCRGRIEAYILSDVVGDPLDVIASGPTAPDPTTFADALRVLEQRGLAGRVAAVDAHLKSGAAGRVAETPKHGDPAFSRVRNVVIGSNRNAVEAARDAAAAMGFHVAGVQHNVEGEAA